MTTAPILARWGAAERWRTAKGEKRSTIHDLQFYSGQELGRQFYKFGFREE